jgi:hypothetical protein
MLSDFLFFMRKLDALLGEFFSAAMFQASGKNIFRSVGFRTGLLVRE